MREVHISEALHGQAEAFHAYVARELGFPSYYGNNLDALNDCLGDVCEPLSLVVERLEPSEQGEWFSRAVRAIAQAAGDNELIHLEVREAPESGACGPAAHEAREAACAPASDEAHEARAAHGTLPGAPGQRGRFPRHLLHGLLIGERAERF